VDVDVDDVRGGLEAVAPHLGWETDVNQHLPDRFKVGVHVEDREAMAAAGR